MTDEQRKRVHAITYSTDDRAELAERIVTLEDENAKMRELCEDMLSCIEIREAFRRPPTAEMCKEFADRARELGIEVDE